MIREATHEDIKSIKLIATLAWQQAHQEILSQELIDAYVEKYFSIEALTEAFEDDAFIVVERDNYIVGFASYIQRPTYLEIVMMLVLPTSQNDGVGTELYDWFETIAIQNDLKIIVELDNGNVIGEAFYRKKGFENVEYYASDLEGIPTKRIVMEKSFDEKS